MKEKLIGIKLIDEDAILTYSPKTHTFLKVNQKQEEFVKYYDCDLETLKSEADIKEDLEGVFNNIEDEKISVIPKITFLTLTNECNMNCSFCYANKNSDEQPGNFQIEWLDTLKEKLPEESFQKCNFSGGEPLLCKDKVMKLRPYFKDVTIYTNGLLIDREFARWAIETNTKFYVNLDYHMEGIEGHAAGPVRKNLEVICNEIPELKKLLEVSVVMPHDRLDELDELRTQQEGFERELVHEFNFIESEASEEEMIAVINKELNKIISGEINLNESIFDRFIRYYGTSFKDYMNVVSCDPGITVSYRGDILLCHEYASQYNEKTYNWNKVSSVDDFTLEGYFDKVLSIRKKGPCRFTECSARWVCGGVCWANVEVNRFLCKFTEIVMPYTYFIMANYSVGKNQITNRFENKYIKRVSLEET